MERLTQRDPDGQVNFVVADDPDGAYDICDLVEYGRMDVVEKIAEKIAKYEDAEKDGRLVVLPCKVGDPVYWIWCDCDGNPNSDIQEDTILYFYVDKNGVGIAKDYYDGALGNYAQDGEIVNDVLRIFLDREAAESTLEMRGE